jgi:cysteinylglycine-S-conjugate dipeptidase
MALFIRLASVFLLAASPAFPAWDFTECAAFLERSSTPEVTRALAVAEANEATHFANLMELLRVESTFEKPDQLERAAEESLRYLQQNTGLDFELVELDGAPPYVLGKGPENPLLPTLLLYAHYDVLPAGEGWTVTQAFEPLVQDGRLWGRGAADDKAAITLFGSAIEALGQSGSALPINFRILIEGEEEIGCPHIDSLIAARPEIFQGVDGIVVADGVNFDIGVPTLTTSLRGIVAAKVIVPALKTGLHSGMYGGPTPDPNNALLLALATLFNASDGTVQIPGVQGLVPDASQLEWERALALGVSEEQFAREAGLLPGGRVLGDTNAPVQLRLSHQIAGRIVNLGAQSTQKTIDAESNATLAFRLPGGVDHDRFLALLTQHLDTVVPFGLKPRVELIRSTPAWRVDPDHPLLPLAGNALMRGFHSDRALYLGDGGTLGLLSKFTNAAGQAPVLLMGIEDNDSHIHAPDENLRIETFRGNRNGLIHFFLSLGEARKTGESTPMGAN